MGLFRKKMKFETVGEVLQVLDSLNKKSESEPVEQYNIILRRTNNEDVAKVLVAAGFALEKAQKIARRIRHDHLIIETTHFERAELIVSRIQELDDDIRVSIVMA